MFVDPVAGDMGPFDTMGEPRIHDVNDGGAAAFVRMAATAIFGGATLGALTNSINGAVSPTCFRNILGWYEVRDVWRASIAQGVFEGLMYGALFAVIFCLAVGVSSKGRAS